MLQRTSVVLLPHIISYTSFAASSLAALFVFPQTTGYSTSPTTKLQYLVSQKHEFNAFLNADKILIEFGCLPNSVIWSRSG